MDYDIPGSHANVNVRLFLIWFIIISKGFYVSYCVSIGTYFSSCPFYLAPLLFIHESYDVICELVYKYSQFIENGLK